MHRLTRMLIAFHLYLITPHPCVPCHVKPGHFPDVVVSPQSSTPQEQSDPTPDDNDGGSDDPSPNPKPQAWNTAKGG